MNDFPIGQGPPARPFPAARDAGADRAGPGVPLSVWPGLPCPVTGPGPCPGPVTGQAAARIIAGLSFPGDLIAAPDGCAEVIHAAWAAGRRVLGRHDCLAAALGSWRHGARRAVLAIAGRHGPGCCGTRPEPDLVGDGQVYEASYRVLAPGGVLAVITAGPGPGGPAGDQPGQAVAAARAAGLIYTQHIVLVHAAIDGDRLTPGSGPGPVPGRGCPGGDRAHTDLLLFAKSQGAPAHD